MAQESLVKDQLTEPMLAAGADLVRKLDKRQFLVDAAMWFFVAEKNEWTFVLATPELRLLGPRKLYKKIQSVLSRTNGPIDLNTLVLVDSKDPLIQLMSTAISIGKGISGIRFSRNTINGRFIDDAYIYRLAA